MQGDKKCTKCGEKMEMGVIVTIGGKSGLYWHKGEYGKVFDLLKITKRLAGGLLKVKVYKCMGCGYLESYAK